MPANKVIFLSRNVLHLHKQLNIFFLFLGGPNIQKQLGCAGLRGSEITLYGEISPTYPEKSSAQSRTKVKTNGHFTSFMQVSFHSFAAAFII